ncbi:lipase family protein [Nocardioides sp. NPDC051685]|uniref:lipase family protein n=1 Tax=Nocardioides sp. NPDC051685 TaxID=3364334 RepID=UPI0037A816C0
MTSSARPDRTSAQILDSRHPANRQENPMHSIGRPLLVIATAAITAFIVTMTPASASLSPLPDLALTQSDFYVPPSPLPQGLPGDLVKSESITASLYPEARATRIMYLSRSARGATVAVTGVLLTPLTQQPGENNPVVVHAPGTRGLGDQCAPSKQTDLSTLNATSADYSTSEHHRFLENGVSVVITDYVGQGTPGLPEYLVGPSEGRNVLDALRAAQQVEGAGLSQQSPVGISGYSQGGQAAGWAAELQPSYAPELDLRGVLAGGVPTDMWVEVNHLSGNPVGSGFAIATLVGLDTAYPDLALASRLTADGQAAVDRVKESCFVEGATAFGTMSISEVTTPDVLTDVNWQHAYQRSLLGTRDPGAAAYVYHGTTDTVVPFAQGQELYAGWCSHGADVTFERIDGIEHVVGAAFTTPTGIAWLTDRLHGEPADPGCRVTSTP